MLMFITKPEYFQIKKNKKQKQTLHLNRKNKIANKVETD